MVWYSHLFQNCPQFIVIHTVKGFGIVKKAAMPHSADMTNSVVWFLIHFLGISVISVNRAHPPPPPSTGLLLSTVQCLLT